MKKFFEEPIINVIEINDVVTNHDTSDMYGGGFED